MKKETGPKRRGKPRGPEERCFGPTAVICCLLGIILFIVGIATRHWAEKTAKGQTVNTGLYQSCLTLNNTCYDTATHFDAVDEKNQIIASAVLCAFATAGMIFALFLDLMYLCGLFEEKSLATASIICSWMSACVGSAGIALFGISITSLDYNLTWSFFVAVIGVFFIVLSGIFMIVAKYYSTKLKE